MADLLSAERFATGTSGEEVVIPLYQVIVYPEGSTPGAGVETDMPIAPLGVPVQVVGSTSFVMATTGAAIAAPIVMVTGSDSQPVSLSMAITV